MKVIKKTRADGCDCWGRPEYEDYYIVENEDGKIIYTSKYDPTDLIKELENNKVRKFYIVIYSDWDCDYNIKGVFTDKNIAEKCKEYELKFVDINDKKYGEYGRYVKIIDMECSDNVDFGAKILELEENKRKEKQAKEDAIKEADLAEFNRIKEKYGL